MKLDKFIKNLQAVNINSIIAGLLRTTEYEEYITGLNKLRLAKKGEYVDGKKIKTFFANTPNVYAARTINIKQEKSGTRGITDHVTLFDSGFFYGSFALKVKNTFFSIIADNKRLNQLENNIVIEGVLGLTKQDKVLVSQKLVPDVIKQLRKKIFSGIS